MAAILSRPQYVNRWELEQIWLLVTDLLLNGIFYNRKSENPEMGSVLIQIPLFYSYDYLDGLEQERRNSSALAMELRLSWTKPSIFYIIFLLT